VELSLGTERHNRTAMRKFLDADCGKGSARASGTGGLPQESLHPDKFLLSQSCTFMRVTYFR